MLPWTIYLSFLGAAALLLIPARRASAARGVALAITLVTGVCAFGGGLAYRPGAELLTLTRVPWIPALGIEYFLAVDGINLTLVFLTALAAVAGVLFSWNVTDRPREFFALYLTLIGAVYGVFLSFDLFLLFFFYEVAIIPKYFLIAIWGSTRREYGAMKLVLYSFLGSALVFLGLLAVYVGALRATGTGTFDLQALAQVAYPATFQRWVFPLMFVGFGVLAGLWPLHTWAPTGHVAAPTAASMLLAGVVMKLGAYGALRAGVALFPEGVRTWQEPLAALAVIGIVYGALVALVQRDFKFVIGYSSVSHMGFVMLGLVTLHEVGVSGAVLQMFSHGIIAGLLFGVVGRMVYDRAHTRELEELAGLRLSRRLPFAAATFVVASLASMGLPGFSGFVAEISVLIGAWQSLPLAVGVTGIGIVLGVAYLLRAMQHGFFAGGEAGEINPPGSAVPPLPPITWPEKVGAGMLLLTTVVIGLFPRLLLDYIVPSVQPLVSAWKQGGGS
ncbi:MAG: NADH-quinone oxidoreductase subunit M [Verrucomicrobiales bacterium]|nr:NADH-quinone oxidoreductase subunit M [Verrucomicrobiales bacterium]